MSRINNLAAKDPKLASEWHPTKNGELTPANVAQQSNRKVWWQCSKGHEWEAIVSNRVNKGVGCPICSNKKAGLENCLAILRPEIAKEWHPTKNGQLTPYDCVPGSGKQVWWQCGSGHEWETSIQDRTLRNGIGCPFCAKLRPSLEYCLATNNPDLIKEWHPDKNGSLTPYDYLPSSNKKVWWLCNNGHEWEAVINHRNGGSACPYCQGQLATPENNLAVNNPLLAKEWHPIKNGSLLPNDVMAGAKAKTWWMCEKGHEWEAAIYSRNTGIGCPFCSSGTSTSFPEQALFYYLSKIFNDTKSRYKMANKEVDIFIPEIHLAIEYDGLFFHEDKRSSDEAKNRLLRNTNIKLIRVREEGLPNIDPLDSFIIERKRPFNNVSLKQCLVKILLYLKSECSLTDRQRNILDGMISENNGINIENDLPKIQENILFNFKENSLLFKKPELAKEWHPTKNGNLSAADVASISGKMVWWQCRDGHEWKATIANRNKTGCPFCSGNKVNLENCLATINPEIAKEWHPTKNGELIPYDVTPGSNAIVWWICKKGHEWQATIANRNDKRNKTNGCPLCLGERASIEYCLAIMNPELAKEWHPDMNGSLTPYDVTPGSKKITWWRCKNGHDWEARISHRVIGSCPCPGCRSIAFNKPDLIKEWHPTKNGNLNPFIIAENSPKKVWWQCSKGHEWEAIISNRNKGAECPFCCNRAAYIENCLATKSPELAGEWHPTENGELTPYDVTPGSHKEAWWICNQGHAWRATIKNRVHGSGCPLCHKNTKH